MTRTVQDGDRIWDMFVQTADVATSFTHQLQLVDALIHEQFPGGKGGVGIANARKARELKQLARAMAQETLHSYRASSPNGAGRDLSATGEC